MSFLRLLLTCGTYMLFDLIYHFFLHIIGWRLSVSINDMLCYVIITILMGQRPWQRYALCRVPFSFSIVSFADFERYAFVLLAFSLAVLSPYWKWNLRESTWVGWRHVELIATSRHWLRRLRRRRFAAVVTRGFFVVRFVDRHFRCPCTTGQRSAATGQKPRHNPACLFAAGRETADSRHLCQN